MRDYSTTRAQPVNQRIALPPEFPALPEAVVKRFPEAKEYNDLARTFWGKVRRSLVDSHEELATPQNDLRADVNRLTANFIASDGSELLAAITTEATVRADADGALATRIDTVEAAYIAADTTINASIVTETTARVNADGALASQITTLTAAYIAADTAINASITTESTARVNADNALATRATTLESQVQTPTTGLLARVSTVESTYATTSAVSASISTAISAEVTNRNTAITASATSLTTAYTAADGVLNTALGGRITTLESQVQTPTTGLLARVTTVESTKVDASGAYAQANSAITASLASSTAGTIGAAVNTEASARVTADGFLAGKYTLKVTAGDVVTGFNITSSTGAGTDTSSVTFNAGVFRIYNGTSGVAPFTVTGGVVYAQNLVVDGSLVANGSISTGKLNFTAVTSTNVVASINATAEGIQISGARIAINGSTTFASGYDPTGRIANGSAAADVNANVTTISGGKITANTITATQIAANTITASQIASGTITTTQLNFTPVQSTNVVASINASAEGIQISGARIAITGSTTFASGYDPTGRIANGSAAADVNANVTTINGGKITANTITADKINVSTLSAITANLGTVTAGTLSAGTTFAGALSAATGTFSGSLSAATGSFSGAITSTSGTIGGYSIGPTTLSASGASGSITLSSAGSISLTKSGYSFAVDGEGWAGGGISYKAFNSAAVIYIGGGSTRITLASVADNGNIGFQSSRSIDYNGNAVLGTLSCGTLSPTSIDCSGSLLCTGASTFNAIVGTANNSTINLGDFRIGCGRTPTAGAFVGYLMLTAADGTTLNVPFHS